MTGQPGRTVKQPRDKWVVVEGTHPPLVDQKTWDSVQATFEGPYRGPAGRKLYALNGLVFCGLCTCPFHLRGGSSASYACSKRKMEGDKACENARAVRRESLERAVNGLILEVLESRPNARMVRKALTQELKRRRQQAAAASRSSDTTRKRAEIRKLERLLRGHLDFIGKTGRNAPESLTGEIRRLEARIPALKEQLETPVPGERKKAPTTDEIYQYMGQIANALERGDPRTRNELYRRLIQRIEVYPDSITIKGNPEGFLPEGERPGGLRVEMGQHASLCVTSRLNV